VPDDPTTRKRLRMQGWDFTSPGWCFLTLCTQNMRSEFGAVVNGHMKLNEAEHVADIFRRETPAHFPRTAWCNQYVLAHCERAAIGHLTPDGILACILHEANPEMEIFHL
jgi:hypothetical protein